MELKHIRQAMQQVPDPLTVRAEHSQIYKPLNNQQIELLAQTLPPDQVRVLIAERACRKLRQLSTTEFHNTVVDVLSEIKLITGGILYEGKELEVQVEMVKRFLWSAYSILTKEEIVHAFYLNAHGAYEDTYRHYNREINAEFIGDVLQAYLRYKKYIVETRGPEIKKLLNPQIAPKELEAGIDYNFWKQLIQEEYTAYRNGETTMQLWSDRKFHTLVKFGLMPYHDIEGGNSFMRKALASGRGGTYLPENVNLDDYKFTGPAHVRSIFKTTTDFERCLDYARRLAYWYVLKACMDCSINNLFTEIQTKWNTAATVKM